MQKPLLFRECMEKPEESDPRLDPSFKYIGPVR
jgi:hypothetical protein